MNTPTRPISRTRFNKEYFGYIVGFPNGEIVLAQHSAGPLLLAGVNDKSELTEHLLDTFEVRSGFHLEVPPLVWLELTRRCNLDCPHCYINGGAARDGEMGTTELLSCVDELADMGVWAIAITGGEPMLHPDFVEIVNYAHSKGLLIGIATNGTLFRRQTLDKLPREGVIISVSIDGLHLPTPGLRKEFLSMTRALRLAREMGFEANIMTNTTRLNIEFLPEVIAWARQNDISVRSVPFSPLGRGHLHAKELENTIDEIDAAARFWIEEVSWEHEFHKRVGLCVGAIFNYGLSLAYMTRRCSSGRFLCYICADGTVYPCTMCAGEEILSPGNIRDRGFRALWSDPWEIRAFSWDNFQSTCNGCILNTPEYYCSSRCPAMSHARHRMFFGCGASDFEIASTVLRTALLNSSSLSEHTGQPIGRRFNT